MRAPADVSPLPTVTLIVPDVPDVDEPVRRTIDPVLPLDEVPDFNDKPPLTPFAPPSEVRTVNAPLLRTEPKPVVIDIEPPDIDVLSPASRTTRPPAWLLPLPTIILTLPLVPDFDEPLLITTEPLLPIELVPDFISIEPLVPPRPESDVSTENVPLLLIVPYPLEMDSDPPDTLVLSPPFNTTRPPAFSSPLPTVKLILPAVPSVDEPVFRTADPELPLVDVPVFNETVPLTPPVPDVALRIEKAPLLLELPKPVTKETEPPLADALSPALIVTRPARS
jgi:hypothetical protein